MKRMVVVLMIVVSVGLFAEDALTFHGSIDFGMNVNSELGFCNADSNFDLSMALAFNISFVLTGQIVFDSLTFDFNSITANPGFEYSVFDSFNIGTSYNYPNNTGRFYIKAVF